MLLNDFDPCSQDEFRSGLTSLETDGSTILVVGAVDDSSFAHMSSQLFGDPALGRTPFVGSPDAEPAFAERLADAGFDPADDMSHHTLGLVDPNLETVRNRLSRALWLNASPNNADPGTIRVGIEITSLLERTDPDTVVETLTTIRDLSKEFHAMTHLLYRNSLETLLDRFDTGQLETAFDIIVRLRDTGEGNPEQQWVLLEQNCTSDWIDPSSAQNR